MVYDFTEQLEKGKEAEKKLDNFFSKLGFTIEAVSLEEEKKFGIDRILTYKDSSRWGVEYKTDFLAKETGNAFVEILSTNTKLGWLLTSLAQILVYYVPEKTVYVLQMVDVRRNLPKWKIKYPIKSSKNVGYKSEGLLVPLSELALAGKAFYIEE